MIFCAKFLRRHHSCPLDVQCSSHQSLARRLAGRSPIAIITQYEQVPGNLDCRPIVRQCPMALHTFPDNRSKLPMLSTSTLAYSPCTVSLHLSLPELGGLQSSGHLSLAHCTTSVAEELLKSAIDSISQPSLRISAWSVVGWWSQVSISSPASHSCHGRLHDLSHRNSLLLEHLGVGNIFSDFLYPQLEMSQ